MEAEDLSDMMKIQARAMMAQQELANDARMIEADGVAWDSYANAFVRALGETTAMAAIGHQEEFADTVSDFADAMLERRRRALGVDVKPLHGK